MNANEKRHTLGFGDTPTPAWTHERILEELLHPDPATVSVLERNGIRLPYVGHAEITRQLCMVDPEWTFEPLDIVAGEPAIQIHEAVIVRRQGESQRVEMASMWGYLCVLGVRRLCVGTVEAHKPDRAKELMSDALRNGAMRHGIALGLWMREDPAQVTPLHPAHQAPSEGPRMASDGQKRFLRTLAKERGYDLPDIDRMTAKDAYDLTERLKEMPRADQEEPF